MCHSQEVYKRGLEMGNEATVVLKKHALTNSHVHVVNTDRKRGETLQVNMKKQLHRSIFFMGGALATSFVSVVEASQRMQLWNGPNSRPDLSLFQ